MTSGNRLRFAKIVGKLAFMYDTATASVTTLSDLQYGTMEEFTLLQSNFIGHSEWADRTTGCPCDSRQAHLYG